MLVWNRQRYVKDPRTGKRVSRLNPPEQWVRQEVPELRIIDEALWDRVQARLEGIRGSAGVEKARASRFREQRRPQHLLTGRVRCGVCSALYASTGRDYLGCSAARRQGSCSNRNTLRRAPLEQLILDSLRDRLMRPEAVQAFIAGYTEQAHRRLADRDQQHAQRRQELDAVRKKLDGLVDAIADGLRGAGLQQKLDDLEARQTALTAELAAAPPPAPRLHPNLAELYRRKVVELQAALGNPLIRQEAVELLRGLIEGISKRPV